MFRQPIITLLGHVDHGKTTLLDTIRRTVVAAKEAGGITQAIGTTLIPSDNIKEISGKILEQFHFDIHIPGLLFIDTPGHEAFVTLRKRGGNIADLAILVVDIVEGFMPQTEESLEILKHTKTPFIVAINKIDRIRGWVPSENSSFIDSYSKQSSDVQQSFEDAFYKIVLQLSEHGFSADRFDRVTDFSKTVVCIPVSGKTGDGIPELLGVIVGLSQQYLKDELVTGEDSRGIVLEVKEFSGMGTTIDCVVYSGSIHKGDYIVIGGKEIIIAKIRALMVPEPLRDIRVEKKFAQVEEVTAACGVKIAAPGINYVVAGYPIRTAKTFEKAESLMSEMEQEREEIELVTESEGIVLKSNTIGGLEALKYIFKSYPIKSATIGQITKRDLQTAETNQELIHRVVIGFDTQTGSEVLQYSKDKNIRIMESPVIYHLLDEYQKWKKDEKENLVKNELESVQRPAKLIFLPGTIFRASDPAIIGCEVQGGTIKPGYKLFKEKDLKKIGEIKQIQSQGQNVTEAKNGDRVAVSISGPTVGRQIVESDIFYTDLSNSEYNILLKNEDYLTEHEKTTLNEIYQLKKNERGWASDSEEDEKS